MNYWGRYHWKWALSLTHNFLSSKFLPSFYKKIFQKKLKCKINYFQLASNDYEILTDTGSNFNAECPDGLVVFVGEVRILGTGGVDRVFFLHDEGPFFAVPKFQQPPDCILVTLISVS